MHSAQPHARKALVKETLSDERFRPGPLASLFDVIKPSFKLIEFAERCAYCPYAVGLSPSISRAQEKENNNMGAFAWVPQALLLRYKEIGGKRTKEPRSSARVNYQLAKQKTLYAARTLQRDFKSLRM